MRVKHDSGMSQCRGARPQSRNRHEQSIERNPKHFAIANFFRQNASIRQSAARNWGQMFDNFGKVDNAAEKVVCSAI